MSFNFNRKPSPSSKMQQYQHMRIDKSIELKSIFSIRKDNKKGKNNGIMNVI